MTARVFPVLLTVALGSMGCTAVESTFQCHSDQQCAVSGQAGGRCETTGYCSFTDPSCGSGRRYHDALSNQCVGAVDGGLDDASANPDDGLPNDGGVGDLQPTGDLSGCGSMRLNALHPAVASPGETIWLEGNFGANASVVFPTTGSPASVAATSQTANRLSVLVPSNAARGAVTVQASACVTGSLPLEIVPASATLLPSPLPNAPAALTSDAQALVYTGDRLIALGGAADDSGNQRAVDVATIGTPPPSLPTFAPAGSLNSARNQACAVYVGDRLHVIGGTATGAVALASREEIALANFPGSFTQPAAGLHTARFGHSCAVVGMYLYVFGGEGNGTGNTTLKSIERAPILAPDGELGPFVDTGATLLQDRETFDALVVGKWLYVYGGINDEGSNATEIERASIGTDGTLGSFAVWGDFLDDGTATPQGLNGVLSRFGSVRVGATVYLFGGFSSGDSRSLVLSAPIDASDGLGEFAVLPTTLSSDRELSAAVVINRHLWIIGGQSDTGDPLLSLDQALFQ